MSGSVSGSSTRVHNLVRKAGTFPLLSTAPPPPGYSIWETKIEHTPELTTLTASCVRKKTTNYDSGPWSDSDRACLVPLLNSESPAGLQTDVLNFISLRAATTPQIRQNTTAQIAAQRGLMASAQYVTLKFCRAVMWCAVMRIIIIILTSLAIQTLQI